MRRRSALIALAPAVWLASAFPASAEWAFEGTAGSATRAFTKGTNGTVFEASCTIDGDRGFHISPAPIDLSRDEQGRPVPAALKIDGVALDVGLTCFSVACEVTHEKEQSAAIATELRRGAKLVVEIDGEGVVESYSLAGSADAILKLTDPGSCTPSS